MSNEKLFDGILRERFFDGNIFLAVTYCYNWPGRQSSNLRLNAPKVLDKKRSLGTKLLKVFCLNLKKYLVLD